jgi:hypothetical protein
VKKVTELQKALYTIKNMTSLKVHIKYWEFRKIYVGDVYDDVGAIGTVTGNTYDEAMDKAIKQILVLVKEGYPNIER